MTKQLLAAQQVLKQLEEAGYEAFLVGGCVRDQLLGKQPADYDITTNALPNQVQRIFAHTIPTGLQHGTVSVVIDGTVTEVTTYRVEGEYHDHRRPDEVRFVSQLKEDLLRRDFTINAMAMDRHGKVIDYVGGQFDLQAHIIRTVGKAEERFAEDALRMLRACRFAAQLSFTIDSETIAAIKKAKTLANHLAVERVVVELQKTFLSAKPSNGMIPLLQTKLLNELPPFHMINLSSKAMEESWSKLDRLPNRLQRWVFFLYACFYNDEQCKQVCYTNIKDSLPKFKFSNKEKKQLRDMFTLISNWDPMLTKQQGKMLLLDHSLTFIQQAEQVWQVITGQDVRLPWEKWSAEMPIHQFAELAINGHDLLQATGKKAGPWLRETLEYLYHQVALGRLANERAVLTEEGRHYATS
jgi:tRNA nucleotidyltransferase (CCA-adding enzyme)